MILVSGETDFMGMGATCLLPPLPAIYFQAKSDTFSAIYCNSYLRKMNGITTPHSPMNPPVMR